MKDCATRQEALKQASSTGHKIHRRKLHQRRILVLCLHHPAAGERHTTDINPGVHRGVVSLCILCLSMTTYRVIAGKEGKI